MDNTPRPGKRTEPKFVFLAHWVEPWNWLLWWRIFGFLHRYPHWAKYFAWLRPLYIPASFLYGKGAKAYDEVDRFTFRELQGATWLVRNFGWHFMDVRFNVFGRSVWFRNQRDPIKERILVAVRAAVEAGATVVGFGALTKAEWLTAGGQYVRFELMDLLAERGVWLVHGDTLTAAAVIQRIRQIIRAEHLDNQPVFLTGSTSKIGRAVALALAAENITVRILTESDDRAQAVKDDSGEFSMNIRKAGRLADGADCPIWVTGKATRGKDIIKVLPPGAWVVNYSVPDPLTPELLRRRPDVRHIDGGLMGYRRSDTTLRFTMRLTDLVGLDRDGRRIGVTYACHAGTIVHAAMGWQWHEVTKVQMGSLNFVWRAALDVGFFLPPPTSHLRPVALGLPEVDDKPLWPEALAANE